MTMKTKPSNWIIKHIGLIPNTGTVLDLACGNGRHTRILLEYGCSVTAIDQDISGVSDLSDRAKLSAHALDLENRSQWPFSGDRFSAIIVTNYLYRPLFPTIIKALAPGGILLYETFASGNESLGRPRNPKHLLVEGELLSTVMRHLHVVSYQHGKVNLPRPAVIQRICAVRLRETDITPAFALDE